ncbi:AAA family ATPase [Nitratireductor soli]|uniref:AAA family ATPase n=1 Tax=Nitratireductor soli TaxID=1670619 RepID=UPI00065E694F|nr:AAA family ATPase [Nitratireductor soli]
MNDLGFSSRPKAETWERPIAGPDETLGNRGAGDVAEWWRLIDRVIETAGAMSLSKRDVARKIGMAEGTFSQWFSGKYDGRLDTQNEKVSRWVNAIEETQDLAGAIPTSPRFLKTRVSIDIIGTLTWAQKATDLVTITMGAGCGKTETCRHYRDTRPNVFMATMSPNTRTVHGMLTELSDKLDVMVHNPARLGSAIGRRLERSDGDTLLIIDEAQNLVDDAINQLRHFVDNHKCGVALIGNDEIYGRFTKRKDGPSYAQLKSRVGRRLRMAKPPLEDLHAFIAAWGVTDPDCMKYLTGIGLKGGGLRQIDKTMKQARMEAAGRDEPLDVKHIRLAWNKRDVEEIA